MKYIVLLSLVELTLLYDAFWAWLRRLPPMISLPSVELVAIGDGYLLVVEGRSADIE